MYTALYYPHIKMRNPELAKTALLLWDKVSYINPFSDYKPLYEDRELAAAAELLTLRHIPTDDEKRRAHLVIAQILQRKLPQWFVFDPENRNLSYEIMPEKLLPETWDLLLESDLVQASNSLSPGARHDYAMHTSLGLTLMSILANICAGREKKTITDESDSYAALTRYFTVLNHGTYGNLEMAKDVAPETQRLVTISVNTLSGKHVSVRDLVQLRKQEERAKQPFLRELRRKYFDEIAKYVDRLQLATSEGDREDVEHEFEIAMEDDLENLRKELKLESWKLLFSKEMLAAVAVSTGALIEPVTTTTISSALLGKALHDHRENKRIKYKGHPMSYLYSTRPSRLYG
jgi:hypothetical protein